MSVEKLRQESERWLRQARDDCEAAQYLLSAGKRAQAGFFAQQAAEKAIKGAMIARDLDPWGHSAAKLIDELVSAGETQFAPLRDDALALDKLYIPTRYPDAVPDLIPAEAFSQVEIEQALAAAARIIAAAAQTSGR